MSASRRLRLSIALCLLATALTAAAADSALAQSGMGDRVGDEVTNWGQNLLFGAVTFMGAVKLFTRKYSEGMGLAAMAIPLGAFAFAPDEVETFIKTLVTGI